VVLADSVEAESELVGERDALECVLQRPSDCRRLTDRRLDVAVGEAVDPKFHA
jgi:hypothetical protein